MIALAKRSLQRLLAKAGYRIVSAAAYEDLLSGVAQSGASWTADHPVDRAPLAVPTGDADLAGFLKVVDRIGSGSGVRRFLLYAAAWYLTNARLAGAVVDCGDGETATLTVIAAALKHFGDTSRHLTLLDTTADPLHRADVELDLWGTDRDLLEPTRGRRLGPKVEPAPPEIVATGYPTENVSIQRYPREPIAPSGPIAFLGLTSDAYKSNRTAIAAFLPWVVRGGVITVNRGASGATSHDAVDEIARSQGVDVLLVPVTPTLRIGIKR